MNLLYTSYQVGWSSLINNSHLLKHCVCTDHLVGDLSTQHNAVLVLPYAGDIARPHLQTILPHQTCCCWVVIIPPDKLQPQLFHHLKKAEINVYN